jgi:signal transduction histidine kinase
MSESMEHEDNASERVEGLARKADLGAVAGLLTKHRDMILANWLALDVRQVFHQGRAEYAVSDDIPRLFDALIAFLTRATPRWIDPGAPLDDPAILSAAKDHARSRFEQGLQPGDIVTEFRLLRQEIGYTLRVALSDSLPLGDVLGAHLLVNDAIDGAITLALSGLSERVNAVREEFLASTVHEVRQPITALRVSLQLARRALTRPDGDMARAVDAIDRAGVAALRMDRLLMRLTEASRVALGQLAPQRMLVDLRDIVKASLEQLDPAAAARVRFDASASGDLTGQWDPHGIREVIDNVLSNALKYAPDGSPIDLEATTSADWVEVRVRVRGIGLSAEDRAGLFRRYGRGPGAVSEGIPGLGLGLYLCRGIVEAHAGEIRAESPGPGRGTTIIIRLPRLPPDPEIA